MHRRNLLNKVRFSSILHQQRKKPTLSTVYQHAAKRSRWLRKTRRRRRRGATSAGISVRMAWSVEFVIGVDVRNPHANERSPFDDRKSIGNTSTTRPTATLAATRTTNSSSSSSSLIPTSPTPSSALSASRQKLNNHHVRADMFRKGLLST